MAPLPKPGLLRSLRIRAALRLGGADVRQVPRIVVPRSEAMRQITLSVQVDASGWGWRASVAKLLFRLAAFVLGCRSEVSISGTAGGAGGTTGAGGAASAGWTVGAGGVASPTHTSPVGTVAHGNTISPVQRKGL